MSSSQVEEARKKSREIVERAANDEPFRKQLNDDPEGALRAAGLPDEVIPEFIREQELGDVSGYASAGMWCVCTACCVTSIRVGRVA